MKKIILIFSVISILCLVGCNKGNSTQQNEVQENQNIQQQLDETKDEVNIKQLLVSSDLFKLDSAHDSTTEDDYFKYWGTSYRYGGGVEFFDDDTFFYSIGIWAETFDRAGTYVIDTYNNKITYRFQNGRVLEGAYKLENGKITEVTYIDYNEDDPIYVTLRASTEEEILERKIEDSFAGEWKFENATKGGEEYYIENYLNWNPMLYNFSFPDNDDIIIDSNPGYTYKIDIKENKILFNIVTKNYETPTPEIIKNASSYFYYELDENNEIVRLTYVENENKNDELRINFTR